MTIDADGTREWARITKENIGRPIAIVLDDVVYSAPNVNTEIPNGQSQITGNFTVDEADDLANTLNSGKMAASFCTYRTGGRSRSIAWAKKAIKQALSAL